MKKILGAIAIAVLVIFMIVVSIIDKNENHNYISSDKNITINVLDKESKEIFNRNIKTNSNYLIEVASEIKELKLKTKDDKYGAYITSVMDIEQGENFYWTYYIDNEYATTGITNCKLEEGKTYTFKIEEY